MNESLNELQMLWEETDDCKTPDLEQVRLLVRRQRRGLWQQIFLDSAVLLVVAGVLVHAGIDQLPLPYLLWAVFCLLWGVWVSGALIKERLREMQAITTPTSQVQAFYQSMLDGHNRRTRFSYLAMGIFAIGMLAQFTFFALTRPLDRFDIIGALFGVFWLALFSGVIALKARYARRRYESLTAPNL